MNGPLFGGTPFGSAGGSGPGWLNLNQAFGNNALTSLAQMILGPMLAGAAGPNYVAGQLFPTTDFLSFQQLQQQMATHQAMQSGAQGQFQEQLLNLYRTSDFARRNGLSQRQEQVARSLIQDATFLMPSIALTAPGLLDMVAPTGSSYAMATQMFLGSRYAADPMSGLLGYSTESGRALSDTAFRQLYGRGMTPELHGVRAGLMGGIYNELQTRGYGLGAAPETLAAGQAGGAAGMAGALQGGPGGLVELMTSLSQLAASSPRAVNAQQITQGLRNLTGWVSAMREVFSDLGQPDASAAQLVEGLEALTQGGLATQSGQRLSQTVRATRNIANLTGVGTERALAFTAGAAPLLEQQGLARQMAPLVGQYGMLGGRAYGNRFGLEPTWRGFSPDQAAVASRQLAVNAAGSEAAQFLAATARAGEQGMFQAGSQGQALYEALQRGESFYEFGGQRRPVFHGAAQWYQMVQGSAQPDQARAVRSMVSQSLANEEAINRFNLVGPVRGMAWETDFRPLFEQAIVQGVEQTRGWEGRDARPLAAAALDAFRRGGTGALFDVDRLTQTFQQAGVGDAGQARRMAQQSIAEMRELPRRHRQMSGFESGENAARLHDPQARRLEELTMRHSGVVSELQAATAHLNAPGSFSTRVVEALLSQGGDSTLSDAALRSLGFTPSTALRKALESAQPGMRRLLQQGTRPDDMRTILERMQVQLRDVFDAVPEEERRRIGRVTDLTDPGTVVSGSREQNVRRALLGLAIAPLSGGLVGPTGAVGAAGAATGARQTGAQQAALRDRDGNPVRGMQLSGTVQIVNNQLQPVQLWAQPTT